MQRSVVSKTQATQARTERSVVQCRATARPDRKGPVEELKRMALAAGAAALLMAEPSIAVAKTAPAPTQGQFFDEILEQQKKGEIKSKIIQGKSAPSQKAVYGQQNKSAVKKPAATTKAPAKKAAAPSASKPAAKPSSSNKPLKFSEKASIGTQGSAPAGVELPVPKGAVTKAKVTKAAAPKPKPVAPAASTSTPKPKPAAAENPLARKKKAAAPTPAPAPVEAPKPVSAAPKPAAAENPLARKKKAALAGAGAGTAAVVVEKAVEKAAPAVKAPVEKVTSPAPSSTSSSSAGLGDATVQAGGVAVAELAGLAIASSIVGGLLKSQKPQRG